MKNTLTVRNAIECLDGHSILSEATAREVCAVLEVPFPEAHLMVWQTTEEALEKYGFFATQAPCTGIDGLALSYHVAKEFGLETPGHRFTGVGFQSRANQQAINLHLIQSGKL